MLHARVEPRGVDFADDFIEYRCINCDKSVTGGWEPHLHFQLSWEEPTGNDMPGVVSRDDREWALEKYPDPRIVLGRIY